MRGWFAHQPEVGIGSGRHGSRSRCGQGCFPFFFFLPPSFGSKELILQLARESFHVGGVEFGETVGDEVEIHVGLLDCDNAQQAVRCGICYVHVDFF